MDKARKFSDSELEDIENYLIRQYSLEHKRIFRQMNEYLQQVGEELKNLEEKYKAAVSQKDIAASKKLSKQIKKAKRRFTIGEQKYKSLVNEASESLSNVNSLALDYVNNKLPQIYTENYNVFETVAKEINKYSFDIVDVNTVKNLANSKNNFLPYKVIDKKKDVRWNTKKINNQVLQGILRGENMNEIAKRLRNVTEMSKESSIRNARTMVTSAECKGRYDSYEKAAKDGVILQKEWLAVSDSRTRDAHIELNGQIIDYDMPFENSIGYIQYPGDPSADPANVYNCRCSIAAKVVGFKKVK